MTILLDYSITDDPAIRRAQIVEVVVSHCASMLWATKPERLAMAKVWASSLRNAIHRHRDSFQSALRSTPNASVTSRQSETPRSGELGLTGSATPPRTKRANNGLSVASADVILCREAPRHRSERCQQHRAVGEGVEDTRSDVMLAGSPACGVSSAISEQSSRDALAGGDGSPTLSSAVAPSSQPSSVATSSSAAGGAGNGHATHGGATLPAAVKNAEPLLIAEEGGVAATLPGGDVVFVSSSGSPLEDLSHPPDFPTVPMQVRRLSGGITNELFHVFDAEDPSTSVVVRVYGKETERVISRESELFYQSLFLNTFVHGSNFLIYEFLANHETLPYTEMASEAGPIARAMAVFQVRATRAARGDREEPLIADEPHSAAISGSRTAVADGSGLVPRPTRFERESNYTVHSLTVWVGQITSQDLLTKVNVDKRMDFLDVARRLCEESNEMLAILTRVSANLGEGVCHNDLLSANVMRHRQTHDLKLIDFDYTKRNFLLFDAANHFNEYTGLECDYEQFFPSDAHISSFVATYREAMRQELAAAHASMITGNGGCGSISVQEIFPNEWELFWGDGVATCARGQYDTRVNAEPEAAVVARWTALAKFLTLCSHLSWSIWSLFQEAVSQLDVDFLEYAKLRLRRYYETKDAYSVGV